MMSIEEIEKNEIFNSRNGASGLLTLESYGAATKRLRKQIIR
jgi:hypothetical protein